MTPAAASSLALASQQGDRAALDRLARGYLPLMHRTVRVYRGMADDAALLSACHEGFLYSARRFRGDGGASFITMAWRMMRHACSKVVRDARPRGYRYRTDRPSIISLDAPRCSRFDGSESTLLDDLAAQADDAADPSEHAHRAEIRAVIARLGLDERDRVILVRRLICDETCEAIARDLGVTKQAINLREQGLRRRLAVALAQFANP